MVKQKNSKNMKTHNI